MHDVIKGTTEYWKKMTFVGNSNLGYVQSLKVISECMNK